MCAVRAATSSRESLLALRADERHAPACLLQELRRARHGGVVVAENDEIVTVVRDGNADRPAAESVSLHKSEPHIPACKMPLDDGELI